MRIVVTGATGNVGTSLVRQLLATAEVSSVVGIARRLPDSPDPRVEWHALDVAEGDLQPVFAGADVVVHLAWLLQPAHSPEEMHRVNVRGSARVIDAVAAAGVPALVHASSIGAYAPASKDRRTAESHRTTGIPTSTYSRHKATVERMLDRFAAAHPERRVVRLRPALILQDSAASAIARYFLGPFVPQSLVRRRLLPVLPLPSDLVIQAVHTDDVAAAYVRACTTPVTGAFNIAAEPVLGPAELAQALHARHVPVPGPALRAAVAAAWRLHLVPVDPGWIDITLQCPVLDTTRARTILGWQPQRDARDVVAGFVDAMGRGEGGDTPLLRPRPGPAGRLKEIAQALIPGAGHTG